MGLLKTLVIIVLAYYIFRLLARVLFPFIVKYFIGKVQKNFRNNQFWQDQDHKREEGEVTIDYIPKKGKNKKKINDKSEYVDFEEVD